jgi:acetyl esterase/lipase
MRKAERSSARVTDGSRAARALLFTALLALGGCSAPTEIHDVQYDPRYGRTTLDLYLPDDGGARRPTVLLIHGGAWKLGDKEHMRPMAQRLARSGWVAASANYHLLPEGQFPRNFRDVACALSFLQHNADEYGIDPKRIAVTGYSAGGHLSALLGVAWDDPEITADCESGAPIAPAAAFPGAGVYDLRGKDRDVVRELFGGTEAEVPGRYRQGSPLTHVRPDLPPFLLITGSADWFVGTEGTREMGDALRNAGNDVEVLTLAGGGHLLNPGADPGDMQFSISLTSPEAWLALSDFLVRHMGEP